MWTLLVAAAAGAAGYFFGKSKATGDEGEHQALITALGLLNRRGRSEILSISQPSRSISVPGRQDVLQVTAPVPYFTPEERRIILEEVRAWQQAEQSRTGMPFRAPTELVTDDEIQGSRATQQMVQTGMAGRIRVIYRWI